MTADPIRLLWPDEEPVVDGRSVTMPLSWLMYGRIFGICRNYSAEYVDGKKSKLCGFKTAEQTHMEGAIGELAAHWYLFRRPFTPTMDGYRSVPDIMLGDQPIEVRTRVRQPGKTHKLELIVRHDDDDDARALHVIWDRSMDGIDPTIGHFTIMGSILAGRAKRAKWLKDHGKYGKPAYFVPNEELDDPEQLRRLV